MGGGGVVLLGEYLYCSNLTPPVDVWGLRCISSGIAFVSTTLLAFTDFDPAGCRACAMHVAASCSETADRH